MSAPYRPSVVVYLHPDVPLYQSATEAAATLGVGRETLREYMRRARDPLPFIRVGRTQKICIPVAIEWLERH
jgi:hypothetical protein